MRHGPRVIAALVLVASPLLLAASDAAGDVAACPDAQPGSPGHAPDLRSARGRIVELGTSALWTLRFAHDLEVPDRHGKAFRVDLLLHDPAAPAVNVAYYRHINRLIRYDAVEDPTLTILLLPEHGQNVFSPPTVDRNVMTFQVPGRILSADEDETGTSPGIENMRWTVVVRDERSCDLLGNGRPTHPMVPAAATSGPPLPSSIATGPGIEGSANASIPRWLWLVLGGSVIAGSVAYGVRRRRDG
jgi:hypothetical protein